MTTSKPTPCVWCSTRTSQIGVVPHDLDLTESALRQWVERAGADRTGGATGLTATELGKLRKENRKLRMERDILKQAAFFAKHQA